MNKCALITGITGMDGSILAESLLHRGYDVHGIIRRSSSFNTARIDHIPQLWDGKHLHYGDLSDTGSLAHLINGIEPDEIYNLGAQSHVAVSYENPEYSCNIDGLGVVRLLECVRRSKKQIKMYHASTSELFGSSPPPQNELTPFHPRSPYAVAKAMGYYASVNYREAFNLFICNGVLFNHTGIRRGETFVERKISRAAARIKCELQNKLLLGNLDAKRDWGHANEFVEGMILMLKQDKPDDFVLATGEQHTVREFLERAFSTLNLNPYDYLEIDPKYYRPAEVDSLCGDYSKAKRILGWEPKVKFNELVEIMVEHDLALAYNESRK